MDCTEIVNEKFGFVTPDLITICELSSHPEGESKLREFIKDRFGVILEEVTGDEYFPLLIIKKDPTEEEVQIIKKILTGVLKDTSENIAVLIRNSLKERSGSGSEEAKTEVEEGCGCGGESSKGTEKEEKYYTVEGVPYLKDVFFKANGKLDLLAEVQDYSISQGDNLIADYLNKNNRKMLEVYYVATLYKDLIKMLKNAAYVDDIIDRVDDLERNADRIVSALDVPVSWEEFIRVTPTYLELEILDNIDKLLPNIISFDDIKVVA